MGEGCECGFIKPGVKNIRVVSQFMVLHMREDGHLNTDSGLSEKQLFNFSLLLHFTSLTFFVNLFLAWLYGFCFGSCWPLPWPDKAALI